MKRGYEMKSLAAGCPAVTLAPAATAAVALDAPVVAVTNSTAADEELIFAAMPVVYSAARREQPVPQAPASVTVITRADIRQRGYRTLADALANVPGLFISNDRQYTYVGVRGLGVPADYNNRILLLLNGTPVNDKYYGNALIDQSPDLMDAVERIEVVKGPVSALYGSNALFAVINIITRHGHDVKGATVSAEVGTGPLGRAAATYGGSFTNGLDLMFSAHFQQDAGESPLHFGAPGTARNADGQQLLDAFLRATCGDFAFQFWHDRRRKELPTGQYGTIVGDDRNVVRDNWYLADLRWQRAVTDNATLMVRGFFEDYTYSGDYVFTNAAAASNYEETIDRSIGLETQLTWQLAANHLLTLGAITEFHWDRLDGAMYDNTGALAYNYPGTDEDFPYWAIYGQHEFRMLPTLTLTTGLRFDNYPDFGFSRLTPRAALVWNATKSTTLKWLYGQAFREPGIYERFYPAGSGGGVVNPSLRAEEITTGEFVAEQDFGRGFAGRLSFFHNEVQNLIAATVDTFNQTVFANVAAAHTDGVEVELTKRFDRGPRAFANATWQNTHSAAAAAVLNSPHWVANAGCVFPIQGDKLALSVRENFVSTRASRVEGLDSGSSFRTDLTLSSQNWLPHWSFFLTVQNLFDQRDWVPSAPGGATLDLIPQPGRALFFRASYAF